MKKLLSVLIICSILIGVIPGMSVSAAAEEIALSKPTELPDTQTAYIEMPFLNGSFFGQSAEWIGSRYALDAVDNFMQADGIMLKVDTSGSAPGNDALAFSFSLSLSWSGGATYFCTTPSLAAHYGKATAPEDTSTVWYYSSNGVSWKPYNTLISTYMKLPSDRTVAYIYIPLSSLWTRDSVESITGGALSGTDMIRATEALELLPEVWQFGMVNFYWRGTTVNRDSATEACEIQLVRGVSGLGDLFANQSVSVGSTLSYNLYLNDLWATDASLTFQMGTRVETVTPTLAADGLLKYTFSNIAPADAHREITATWSGVLGSMGKRTFTYTGSVTEYCRKLRASGAHTEWNSAANALLEYIGVQSADSQKTTVSFDNVNAPDPDIWGAVTLEFGVYPCLRVAVNAPAGVTQIHCKVNGRSAIYPIEEGAVQIPLRIHELFEPIRLSCYGETAVTSHAALTLYASDLLGETLNNSELVKSTHTLASELAPKASHLKQVSTLTQLETVGDMMYVMQLSDGRFVIVDGGSLRKEHTIALRNYLLDKSNGSRPVIACWFITHLDSDHVAHAVSFMEAYSEYIDLQCVAYSFPEESEFEILSTDSEQVVSWKKTAISCYTYRDHLFEVLDEQYPNTERWDLTAGEMRQLADVNFHILMTANEKYQPAPIYTHNNRSVVFRATFTQDTYDTSDDTTAVIFGDSGGDSRGQWIVDTYGKEILKSDVMQVIHHGLSGGYLPLYKQIDPEIVLWPTTQSRLDGGYDGNKNGDPSDDYQWCIEAKFNAWLRDDSIRVRQHYAADDTTIIDMRDLSVTVVEDYA